MYNNLTIFIPDSTVIDCSDLRGKTEQLFNIARAAAIFKATKIVIYHDPTLHISKARRERNAMREILSYLNCPQYLRKRLFPLSNNLSFVGILPPLASSFHVTSRKRVLDGDTRLGAVFIQNKKVMADVGIKKPIEIINPPNISLAGKTIQSIIQIIKENNDFKGKILPEPPKDTYWGYKVVVSKGTLSKAIENRHEFKVATSRSCELINQEKMSSLHKKQELLLAFGSPLRGIPELLKAEGKKIKDVFDDCINILSHYGTRTLRLEEAIMITLTLLNQPR